MKTYGVKELNISGDDEDRQKCKRKQLKKRNGICILTALIVIITCSAVMMNTKTYNKDTVIVAENTENSTRAELIKYINVTRHRLFELNNQVINEYTKNSASKYINDGAHNKLLDDIIADSMNSVRIAGNVTLINRDVKELHEIYLNEINTRHTAYGETQYALETNNSDELSLADDKMKLANKYEQDYQEKLIALKNKYDIQ